MSEVYSSCAKICMGVAGPVGSGLDLEAFRLDWRLATSIEERKL
ncbi:hypothetical protein SAMN06295912_15312 [Sphingomonas laterariae]|uniref:Uncharacterized protein n=1 Tax=Edaphosphingomonas laterariae TaxID=861865 RepID=A0A239KIC9_9SPHN|nr:hypothetical protein SAMN06295912_15312 [Sphingomonas laterariae]